MSSRGTTTARSSGTTTIRTSTQVERATTSRSTTSTSTSTMGVRSGVRGTTSRGTSTTRTPPERENTNPNRGRMGTVTTGVKPVATSSTRSSTTISRTRPTATTTTNSRAPAPTTRGPRGPAGTKVSSAEMKKRVEEMGSNISNLTSQLDTLQSKLAQTAPAGLPEEVPEVVPTEPQSEVEANEDTNNHTNNEDVSTPTAELYPHAFPELRIAEVGKGDELEEEEEEEEEEEQSESSSSEEPEEIQVDLSPFLTEIANLTLQLQQLQDKKVRTETTRKFELESLASRNSIIQTQLDSTQQSLQKFRTLNSEHQFTIMENDTKKQRLQTEIQNTIERGNNDIRQTKEKFAREKKKTESEFQERIDDVREKLRAMTKSNEEQSQKLSELKEDSRKRQEAIDDLQVKANEADAVRRQLCNDIQDLKGNIRILCSVMPPFVGKESNEGDTDASSDDLISFDVNEDASELAFSISGQTSRFKFDSVFLPSPQSLDNLYEEIAPLVESTVSGRNCTLLVYGQSGSGKTYCTESKDGVISRAVAQFFECKKRSDSTSIEIHVNFIEIVSEQVHDLLSSQRELTIKHDGGNTTVVKATTHVLKNSNEIFALLEKVKATREERGGSKNSHTICRIQCIASTPKTTVKSCFSIVELCSAENNKSSGDKSLLNLSAVITGLANGVKTIPYQEAQLTNLLQHSLGGESKTVMSVHISPKSSDLNTTKTTLQFAQKIGACEIGIARKTTMVKV